MQRIPSPSRLLALLCLVALLALGSDCKQEGRYYFLNEGSAWLEGCIFGPCLCPVAFHEDLTGSFRIVELPTLQPGPTRFFAVRNIRWQLRMGDHTAQIRGSGLYTTAAPVLDEQSLTLHLELDGDPLEPIESGLVAGGLSYPAIEIDARTPGECYQTAVQLRAEPFPGL